MPKTKKRRGRATPFGPKDLPPKSVSLTRLAKGILSKAARRAKTSESNVVELLTRKYASGVHAEDFVTGGDGSTAG